MNADGKPEIGDSLVLINREIGEVVLVQNQLFTADEYTVQYPDGIREVVTGYLIESVLDGNVGV